MNYLFRCADSAPSCGVPSCWPTCSLCCIAYCLCIGYRNAPLLLPTAKARTLCVYLQGKFKEYVLSADCFNCLMKQKINARSAILRSLIELFSLNILFYFLIFFYFIYLFFTFFSCQNHFKDDLTLFVNQWISCRFQRQRFTCYSILRSITMISLICYSNLTHNKTDSRGRSFCSENYITMRIYNVVISYTYVKLRATGQISCWSRNPRHWPS